MTTDIKPCCDYKPEVEQQARLHDPAIMEYRIRCLCGRRTGWCRTMEAALCEWGTFDLAGEQSQHPIGDLREEEK